LFGTKKAVDNISFKVEKGEILGFLGPNGAGKTTTMRIIAGFIPASSGTAIIGGHDIIDDSLSARKMMGYLPENAPVYPDMNVIDYLDFCAQIRGFGRTNRQAKVKETIEKCFLSEATHQTISTLSKGFKQRVCFAQSILHDPEYLIFDEPTDGLDPNQKHEVRQMILEMSPEKAIILSTHILDEVDAVCSRAIIIADGCIVADDTPENIKARSTFHGAILLSLANTEPQALLSCIHNVDGVKTAEILEKNESELKVRIYPEQHNHLIADKIMSSMLHNNYIVRSIFVEQGRLDEVFRDITIK
jgi:ABC-2 type transport system ATP-binding protein